MASIINDGIEKWTCVEKERRKKSSTKDIENLHRPKPYRFRPPRPLFLPLPFPFPSLFQTF